MILTHRGILLEEDETNTRSVTGEVVLPFDRLDRALKIAHSMRYDARSNTAVKYALKVMEERDDIYPITEKDKEKYGQDGEARIAVDDYIYLATDHLNKEISSNEAILHTLTNAVVEVTKEQIYGGFCNISSGGTNVFVRIMFEYNDILTVRLSATNRIIEAEKIRRIACSLKKIKCVITQASDAGQPWGQYMTDFYISSIGCKIAKTRGDEIIDTLSRSIKELNIGYSIEDNWVEKGDGVTW